MMLLFARYRRSSAKLPVWAFGALLAAIIVLAITVRVAAALVLRQPLDGDTLAYFTMARGLAERGELLDMYGQHAFFSAGYPLLLAPFFTLLGSTVPVALVVNLLLGVVSTALIYRLTLILSGNRRAGLLAALVYALWVPGIWNATMLAKENLSTPLLIGVTMCAISIARDERPIGAALIAGMLWGASLITGGSTLLLCGGIAVALVLLWQARNRFMPAFSAGLCFIAGTALFVSPWLYATDQMVGRPVLTTNAAFNLYLGNNPAATGKFVSISDTPMGKGWEETRIRLGEIANADRLQVEALHWIRENPGKTAELAAVKLAYFWQPNIPDAADFATSKAVAWIRLFEVVQYGLILLLGFLAFRSKLIARDGKWILASMIAGFWLIHAAAYIIARYRDPAIPLLIVMGAIPLAAWLEQFAQPMDGRHVA
jgi:4-amino-4-deoxy-L-arabinose transferase-like glycosyltransferase